MHEWIETVTDQDGLVRRDRALRLGVDPDQLMKALRSGRLRRVQRGYYIRQDTEVRPLALARAAVLASGVRDAVASHQTAARVHGLQVPVEPGPEHVTVPRNQRRLRRRELVWHSKALGCGQVEVHRGVPLTTVERTVVDLAATLPRVPAVWAVDDALRRGLVRRERLDKCLEAQPGGAGAAVARERVGAADGLSESALATAARLAVAGHGLPMFTARYQVRDQGAVVATLDGAYPELRLGLEFDGQDVHGPASLVFGDWPRQNRLLALGWGVLRFTWWDITHDEPGFVAAVLAGLQRARQQRWLAAAASSATPEGWALADGPAVLVGG